MKKYSPTPVPIRTSQLRSGLAAYLVLVQYDNTIFEVRAADGRGVRAYIVPAAMYEEWLLLEWERNSDGESPD